MQRKGGLTQAEYARLRGLNRSTISRQVREGKIPVTADGRIDPVAADRARERNLDAGRRQDAELRKESAHVTTPTPAATAAVTPGAVVGSHAAVVDAIRRVASPLEVLAFARVALRAGASATLAFVVGSWYATQPCMALEELDENDVSGFGEPTEAQWRELLGDFDLNAAWELYDQATPSEGVRV
jgi:hypothetical protein